MAELPQLPADDRTAALMLAELLRTVPAVALVGVLAEADSNFRWHVYLSLSGMIGTIEAAKLCGSYSSSLARVARGERAQ